MSKRKTYPATWSAVASVEPIRLIGTRETCNAWMESILGREITVTDAAGKKHVIGVVKQVCAKELP